MAPGLCSTRTRLHANSRLELPASWASTASSLSSAPLPGAAPRVLAPVEEARAQRPCRNVLINQHPAMLGLHLKSFGSSIGIVSRTTHPLILLLFDPAAFFLGVLPGGPPGRAAPPTLLVTPPRGSRTSLLTPCPDRQVIFHADACEGSSIGVETPHLCREPSSFSPGTSRMSARRLPGEHATR